jgi:hypothetical protein
MKKTLWIVGGIVAILLVVWFVILPLISSPVVPSSDETPSGSVSLPTGGSVVPVDTTSNGSAPSGTSQLTITTSDKSTIITKDFIHNGETVADTVNPGLYQLAGSLEYCLADGTCPSGAATTDFSISFNSKTQFFTIALLAEPIGTVRGSAEQFLISRLGVSPVQACSLQYFIGTPNYVNASYSGKNLGFSFCPGAVKLPTK